MDQQVVGDEEDQSELMSLNSHDFLSNQPQKILNTTDEDDFKFINVNQICTSDEQDFGVHKFRSQINIESSDDNDDFNMQKFRSQGGNKANKYRSQESELKYSKYSNTFQNQRRSTQLDPDNKQVINNNSNNQSQQQKFYFYLGMKFELQCLLERNKNPFLVLNLITISAAISFLTSTILVIFATKRVLIGLLIQVIFGTFTITFIFSFLNVQLSKLKSKEQKLSKKIIILFVFTNISGNFQVLYCLIWDIPFQKIVYYLIALEFNAFFLLFAAAVVILPNNIPTNDQIYQQRYLISRILMAILNSTGIVDVLSDIVVGVELILVKDNISIKILGISLILLCIIDLQILNVRVISPEKVTLYMHIGAVVFEVGILFISVFAFFLVQKEQTTEEGKNKDRDFEMLLYLSMTTTCINFVHHIFVIFESWVHLQVDKMGFNMSILYT